MPDEASAVQRIARGTVQTLSSVYAARMVNFVVLILLQNILVPGDFGAIENAFSLLALVISFRDIGVQNALLHEYDRVHDLAPTYFVLSIFLGGLSTLVAGLIAVFYDDALALTRQFGALLGQTGDATAQKIAIAIVIFGVVDLFNTAALTAETQLRRDLAFGYLALARASATILAAAVGLAVAYMGYGKWALILGFFPYSVTYVAVFCTFLWMRHPPPLRGIGQLDRDAARRMMHYGLWFWVGNIAKTFVLHYDKLVVAFLIGLDARGLYDAAHRYAQMPTGAITLAIVSITGTVYARYHQDRAQLSGAFRRTLRLVLRATVPISFVLALEAPHWLHILRPEWMPVAPILQCLIVYSLCRPILDDLYALFYGVGAPKTIAVFAAAQAALLLLLAPLLTGKMGVYGTAVGMDAAALAGLIIALRMARRFVDFPVVKTFAPPLLAAAIGFALHNATGAWTESLPISVEFIVGSAVFLLSYGLSLLAIEGKPLLSEMQTVVTSIRPGSK